MTTSTPHDSADLILRLYDLRREAKMREARDWAYMFNPKSTADIVAVFKGPDSAKLRMVMGYWDMAAALVNHGAIDEAFFHDTNGEFLYLFAKMQPFLEEFRAQMGAGYLKQVEQLVMRMPDAAARLEKIRARFA